jgi:hypothetical protein
MIKRIKQRAETGLLTLALVIPLALCVFAFLGAAGYFTFRESLPPNLAALVTAACGIVLIALTLVIAKLARWVQRREQSTSFDSGSGFELGGEIESYLRDHADPVLSGWIRDHPDKAALATLALGVAAGYSGQFRRLLMDAYSRYAESESARRSGTDRSR